MKKTFALITTILITLLAFSFTSYGLEKLEENITTEEIFFNDFKIPFIKVGENRYININTFKNYGFDVIIDKENKNINISQNPDLFMKPFETDKYKAKFHSESPTDFEVNINGNKVEAKKIGSEIAINIKSFSDMPDFGFKEKIKDESYRIYICSYGFENLFTLPEKQKLHITKKGDSFYSKDLYDEEREIGFIKDNIEWISYVYLSKLMDDEKASGRRYDNGWIELFRKGKYSLEIETREEENEANAEIGWDNYGGIYQRKLLEMPQFIDDELYIPLVNLVELLNLEMIRDDQGLNKVNENKSYGNEVNGINIIKTDKWMYYINRSDRNKLYKATIDKKQDIKISDDFITQFVINGGEIFYISHDKGIFKMNLDGSNKQNIFKGETSYLNIIGDKVYFCEGNRGGELYSINKNGTDKRLILENEVAYPNIVTDTIFYINKSDRNTIYRSTIDGKNIIKLNNIYARSLNVDNEKVYFSNTKGTYFMNHDGTFFNRLNKEYSKDILIGDKCLYFIGNHDKIYKQRKDRVYNEEVHGIGTYNIGIENDNIISLQQKTCFTINSWNTEKQKQEDIKLKGRTVKKFDGEQIYYRGQNGELLRYNIKTKENETIIKERIDSIYSIVDGWIYYYSWNNEPAIYRIKTNGEEKAMIASGDFDSVHIDNSGIYYLESPLGAIGDYYRVDLDGSNKQVLINDLQKDYSFECEVDDKCIYYHQKDGIYSITKDGKDKKKITNKKANRLKINNNNIFFEEDGNLYKINEQGKEEKLASNIWWILEIKNGYAYYKRFDKENPEELAIIYKLNIENKKEQELETISNFGSRYLGMDDKYIYLIYDGDNDISKKLYRIEINSKKEEFITELGNSGLVNLYENYIFYVKEDFINEFIVK